ncbi:restriction endonuclease subunit S [Microcoleus sp. T3_A4]|uniref:restriction endonuclease subunit S n=1 Tax=Microcoleus sp. T3_A4 TaxID=2818968 RepID=UPI002FD00617
MTVLDQICLNIIDCEHKTAPIQDSGIPSIRTTDIKGGVIDFRGANKVSEETYKAWTERLEPQPHDLILAREAPVGEIGIIPKGQRACLGQRTVLIRPNPDKVYPHYLLYLMQSRGVQHEMQIRAAGSTVTHLNMCDIRELDLPDLPPLEVQCQIGDTLANLDRKIENLRKQNETLEALAQTLFKHWFVDFEFSNEDGKPYKSSGGEMVRSELGEIPADWRVGKLGKEFDISIGRTPPRQESEWFSRDSKNVKWVSIRDMGSCGTYILETSEYLTKEAISKFGIPIIPENTVIVSFKLTVGRVAITTDSMLSNEAIAHVKVSSDSPTSEYIYLFLSQFNFNKLGSTSSIATAVNSKSIKDIDFLVPAKKVASDFSHIINPLFLKLRVNTQQIHTLTKTRDVLLPQLISGKLRMYHRINPTPSSAL